MRHLNILALTLGFFMFATHAQAATKAPKKGPKTLLSVQKFQGKNCLGLQPYQAKALGLPELQPLERYAICFDHNILTLHILFYIDDEGKLPFELKDGEDSDEWNIDDNIDKIDKQETSLMGSFTTFCHATYCVVCTDFESCYSV